MGVDFEKCDGCGDVFCTNGGSHNCDNCGNTYCNGCSDNLVFWANDNSLFCSDCDNHEAVPDADDDKLLTFVIRKYCKGQTKRSIIDEYNKENGIKIQKVSCGECGDDECGCILENYGYTSDDEYYTLDYRKNAYCKEWDGSKADYNPKYQNLKGAKEPSYMRPKGYCCRCAQVDDCEYCESRPNKKQSDDEDNDDSNE